MGFPLRVKTQHKLKQTCDSTSANLACFSCNVAMVASNSAWAAASLTWNKRPFIAETMKTKEKIVSCVQGS